ncbi:hypothetical protein RDABS01_029910 [Bienertia sinuspersici]
MSTSCKADVITSNLAETFNGYIIHARNKHLVDMMEDIRAQLMQRLVVKRKEMQQHTSLLCPRIQERLEKEKHEAAKCRVFPSSDTLFEVGYYLDTLTVDLDARKCTCRKWDLNGIPCCHAIACIFFCHGNAEDYVHESYTREMYLKTYSGTIPPLEGERHWPTVNMPIDPPPIKVGPGRPRKNRVKDPHENPKKQGKLTRHGIEMTCSSCQRKGHNKRSCPNKGSTSTLPPPQPKRKRGRPKSTGEASISTVHMHESQVGGEEEGQMLGAFKLLQVEKEEEEAGGKGEAEVVYHRGLVMPMSGQPVAGPPSEGNINVSQGGSNQIIGSQNSTF